MYCLSLYWRVAWANKDSLTVKAFVESTRCHKKSYLCQSWRLPKRLSDPTKFSFKSSMATWWYPQRSFTPCRKVKRKALRWGYNSPYWLFLAITLMKNLLKPQPYVIRFAAAETTDGSCQRNSLQLSVYYYVRSTCGTHPLQRSSICL